MAKRSEDVARVDVMEWVVRGAVEERWDLFFVLKRTYIHVVVNHMCI